jgi:predicted membrane channel-forming protein YqfA (hemolysin III family)
MYLFVVLALMLVFPLTSIVVETLLRDHGAATAGMLFYGLAGINHLTHKERNFNENIAMTSDIFAACVMLAFIIHP